MTDAPLLGHDYLLVDPLKQVRILFRYKWQILGVTLIAVLVTLLVVFSVKPTYRGKAKLLIEPKSANVVKIDDVYEPGASTTTSDYLNTQAEILRSRLLAEQIFYELKLIEQPEYALPGQSDESKDPGIINLLRGLLTSTLSYKSSESFLEGDDPVERLSKNLNIEVVPKTTLITISADSESSDLSARIANAVVDAYIRIDREAHGDVTQQASGWLTQRLAEIKADLERSEKSLQSFYESEKLVNVGGARGLVEEEMTDNSRRLREAQKTKTELENVYKRITQANNKLELLQEIPAIQQESLVQSTKTRFLEANQEVGGLESRYGNKHPKMVTAQARLEEARAAYQRQVLIAAEGIRSQYEIARNTEQSVAGVVQGSKAQIQGLDRKQHELEVLQREVDSNRKLFDTFLERYKETDIAGNLDIGKIRIVERAVVPRRHYRPRKSLWLLTAAFGGFFVGILTALLRDYLDKTIKSPLDIEEQTGVPALSVLPIVEQTGKRGERIISMELAEPSSAFAEGIRTIRTSLMLSEGSKKMHRILVTSAVPAEGKTSVAINLAEALGQVERTILVDADLRRPSIAEKLKLPADANGLVEVISGQVPLKECIHRFKEGNIDILPCGKLPDNPLELLSSPRFAILLKNLGEHYDRVIIDSPPCQPVSDSRLLGVHCDAVIFLVKADSTPSHLVTDSIKQLRLAGAPIVGAVLNQVDFKRRSGFAYGYYYYRDGYGSYKATA